MPEETKIAGKGLRGLTVELPNGEIWDGTTEKNAIKIKEDDRDFVPQKDQK